MVLSELLNFVGDFWLPQFATQPSEFAQRPVPILTLELGVKLFDLLHRLADVSRLGAQPLALLHELLILQEDLRFVARFQPVKSIILSVGTQLERPKYCPFGL
jgi:hypothetical protein